MTDGKNVAGAKKYWGRFQWDPLNTIRTKISDQPKQGAGVARALTVNIPSWSDDKK
jgi:hypothetical protein